MVQENTQAVEQREQEIKNIAQSIVALNIIFKDLAAMIVDQVCIFLCISREKYWFVECKPQM